MTRREQVEILLNTEVDNTDDAIALLKAIDNVYEGIGKERQRLVKPYYDAIEKIHEQNARVSEGLWEKRKATEQRLMTLVKD